MIPCYLNVIMHLCFFLILFFYSWSYWLRPLSIFLNTKNFSAKPIVWLFFNERVTWLKSHYCVYQLCGSSCTVQHMAEIRLIQFISVSTLSNLAPKCLRFGWYLQHYLYKREETECKTVKNRRLPNDLVNFAKEQIFGIQGRHWLCHGATSAAIANRCSEDLVYSNPVV